MSEPLKVKPGDEVIYDNGHNRIYRQESILVVDRVTTTQVICGDMRFRLKSGRPVGPRQSSFTFPQIRTGTPEEIQAVKDANEKLKVIMALEEIPWRNFTLENLRIVAQTVKERIG
jgi:hypothetical protein